MNVHRSNRVEVLAARLVDVLAAPLDDPMAPDVVVVHSRGMERWLGFRIADRLPICAHTRWPTPARFVHDCFDAVLGAGSVDLEGWSHERLTWAVAAALPGLLGRPAFDAVRAYVGGAPDVAIERKPMLLAREVARAFAGYVRYRPEMVCAWDRGEGDDWQALLWRAVGERAVAPHLADVARRFAARMDRPERPDALPTRACLFGLTTLPPIYVDALRALGRHVDVHLFALTPSVADGRHPLYASCGRLFSDLRAPLTDRTQLRDAFEAPPDTGSMLSGLHADILAGGLRPRPAIPGDASVQVHACHGAMRQVEVLRDVLVHAFDTIEGLEPRDVLVMTPDIDTYAPLVHAVFADEAEGVLRMPFRVADRAMRHHNQVAEALLTMLGLVGGRVEASVVLDLLALEPVRRRFGLLPEDLPQLRQWVADSGVRWGIDGAHRAAQGQLDGADNTWRAGLDRLLLGRAMVGDGVHLFGDTLPYDGVQGRDTLMMGRLLDYAETLFERIRALAAPRSMAEWAGALAVTVDALFARRDPDAWQHIQLREVLAEMADDAASAGADAPVSLDALRVVLEARLDDRSAPTGFLSGAVTFCELVPMRSIPFRVVCLLGMDDGAFPRSATRPGFDLVDRARQPGDRSRRDDDRALFLEALLAARDRLVVTYTGRDIHDDKPLAPAVPVGELVDVLVDTFGVARDDLVCAHPLQPFSPRNFGPEPRSYDQGALRAARALCEPVRREVPPLVSGPLPPPEPAPVDVDRLCDFLQSPAKTLLGRRLGLWYRRDEDPVSDARPLELFGLDQWKVGQALLELRVRDPDADVYDAFRVSGMLPPGPPGREAFQLADRRVGSLLTAIRAARAGPAGRPIDVDFEVPAGCFAEGVGAVRVVGRVGDLFGDRRVTHQYSKLKPKHRLALWVRHLVLHVTAGPGESHLVGRPQRGDGAATARLQALPLEGARACLVDLLALYLRGQREAMPFFPSTSRAWLERRVKPGAVPTAMLGLWMAEDRDAYVDRVFGLGDTPPWASPRYREDFVGLAERIWRPVLKAEGRG